MSAENNTQVDPVQSQSPDPMQEQQDNREVDKLLHSNAVSARKITFNNIFVKEDNVVDGRYPGVYSPYPEDHKFDESATEEEIQKEKCIHFKKPCGSVYVYECRVDEEGRKIAKFRFDDKYQAESWMEFEIPMNSIIDRCAQLQKEKDAEQVRSLKRKCETEAEVDNDNDNNKQ